MARERSEMHKIRRYGDTNMTNARSMSYNAWKLEWDATDKGSWTHKLIRNFKQWTTRKFGKVDFHLTQLLLPDTDALGNT